MHSRNISRQGWKQKTSSYWRQLFGRTGSKRTLVRAQETVPVDERRRAFLKYALFGSVVFVAGKYTNAIVNFFQGDTIISEQAFQNFKLTETGHQLRVTDNMGEELLIIDKETL